MEKVKVLDQGFVYRNKEESLFGYYGWPTVERLPDGTLIVVASGLRTGHVCFGGKTTMFISKNDGKTWLGPIVVNDTPMDDRDAGILHLGNDKLLVTWFTLDSKVRNSRYKEPGRTPQQDAIVEAITLHYGPELDEKWAGSFCRLSTDGGVTWGDIVRMPVTAPHGPALMRDGSMLIVGKEYDFKETDGKILAVRSRDDGATWQIEGQIPIPEDTVYGNFHEPHVLELPDGKLIAHIRYEYSGEHKSRRDFNIFQSESVDGGKTWTMAQDLDCWGSPPHLLRHSSGALVCVYGRRTLPYGEMCMISWDEGKTWKQDYALHIDAPSRDLGYPSSVELDDGSIFTVYYQKAEKNAQCALMYTRWELPEK